MNRRSTIAFESGTTVARSPFDLLGHVMGGKFR